MPAFPPAALGRGVVVNAGDPVPEPWAGAPRVLVDDDALANPADVVAVLHDAWASRRPVVVALDVDPARFREPADIEVAEPWRLEPDFELWHDRLHFLVWANTYDARDGEPVWWWARKAQRLGAGPPDGAAVDGGVADMVLPDGTPAWIDGGPRGGHGPQEPGGVAVVHAESVDQGRLTPVAARRGSPSDRRLAPDQERAVTHGAGPARVIAPAGSGKTRVLTERLRHLVVSCGYEPEGVVAVAYNRKARDEMVARTPGVGARILTLNALGYELVASGLGRRPEVLEAREVRRLLETLVPRGARRLNTDPLAPYLDALAAVRLGLRDPIDVEDERGDVPGLAAAFPAYRAELRRRGVVDFDEQVLLAIELLLADGAFRRAQQARHRHLLVDEFQDLTPAHVLLIRLLSTPRFDVFGVGDDDQVIYGHAGASPRFLTEFGRYFPAAAEHALEVNYRCPPAVVDATRHLLTRNRVRVPKRIKAGRAVPTVVDEASRPEAFRVRHHVPQAGATELVDVVRAWLGEGSAPHPRDVAVLTRVGSLLLAPHVALVEAGVPVASILGPDVLTRTGLRAALAYLRIAGDAEGIDPRDLVEVYRRPSRGLPNWIERWLDRCRSVADVARAAGRIDDVKVAGKVDGFADDLAKLAALARSGSTRTVLEHVRDTVGLGQAVELLDATGVAGESHRDDLDALLQVADLHPGPGGFEPWLRAALTRPGDDNGVVLSTIHRVKGREWPRVVVFGATDGIMPHRLSHGLAAVEEERRVFHVAITRAIDEVAVLADASRPSPFLAELDHDATPEELPAQPAANDPPATPRPRADAPMHEAVEPDPEAARVEAALRDWRRERSRADGVPAFVVIHDRHLVGIAERRPMDRAALAACPGIGPAKLAAYGDELVSLVRALGAEAEVPGPSESSSDS